MMAGPTIEFRTFLDELRAMRQLANSGGFLSSASYARLESFEEEARHVRSQGQLGKARIVGIPKDHPIETRPAEAYRPSGKGNQPVVGRLSAIWPIRPIGKKKGAGFKSFVIDTAVGTASTRVSICTVDDAHADCKEVAFWRSDIRTADGPGCLYHLQVLGESDDTMFPDFLGIPRFPDPFTSPMAVLEFLLAELFPDEWAKHLSDGPQWAGEWRTIQEKHWKARLDEQKKAVTSPTDSSPWLEIRKWSPC